MGKGKEVVQLYKSQEKKLIWLSFGVAIANTLTEQEPVVPCSASECPGSGVLCCKDAKTGDPFYKRA